MCLAVPARVLSIDADDWAEVEVGGVRSRASVLLVEGVQVGDYVIVHAGFALTRLDVAEAEKALALFAQIAAEMEAAVTGAGADALYPRLS